MVSYIIYNITERERERALRKGAFFTFSQFLSDFLWELKMAAEEEEVVAEVEAVQAVYGEDCLVLDSYPPHLHLHIKPRTADVTSQQVSSSSFPKFSVSYSLLTRTLF